ncbi:MAG TPA: DUF3147 family protein [Patescibacteria group bacterium]|nr:DUF3147 family protein [Patescibacteria group bacterium]
MADVTLQEYAIRFLLGGLITIAAGVIAYFFGAAIGGVFLAFPAIFPASLTLVEVHETQKRDSKPAGRRAASRDAVGASLGSLGLIGFACVVWKFLPGHNAALVLAEQLSGSSFALWFGRLATVSIVEDMRVSSSCRACALNPIRSSDSSAAVYVRYVAVVFDLWNFR